MKLDAGTLRDIASLSGTAPEWSMDELPADPAELFATWLDSALHAGVAEPTAMTLSTFGEDGIPDSRVLRLKSVDERGWAFASTASSVKGQQLKHDPVAALNFWWQPLVRSVRVRGTVEAATAEENRADLAARSAAARAGTNAEDWRVWFVQPIEVEFWQGSQDRQHHRIRYTRAGRGWEINSAS